MNSTNKTIAIAGAGDVAKYIVEEIQKEGRHNVVVLSRAPRDWFVDHNVEIRITDYSLPSLLPSLQGVDILVSLLHDNSKFHVDAHVAMLEACKQSPRCKRFIPSECGGDIDNFPSHPLFYLPTHVPVREALRAQHDVQYVLLNNGWFMDYFIPAHQSYMKRLPVVWPLDTDARTLRIAGDGEAPISFTSARDVAKAIIRLFDVEKWDDPHIYVAGEITTWHKVVELIERIKGIKLEVTYRPTKEIEEFIEKHKTDEDPKDLWLAYMDLWNANGASAVPKNRVEAQRKKYFKGIHFRGVEELIREGEANKEKVL